MNIESRVQKAIFDRSSESIECYQKLQSEVLDGALNGEDVERFSSYVEKVFLTLGVREKQLLLFLLRKVDPDRAYKLAKEDFVNAYTLVNQSVAYLQSVIICRDDFEHFIVRLNAMEVEKMMRLAFALINNHQIKDGDFMPPGQR